ncbi:gliding motility lipoprotein GldH [Flavobacterium amniphilum]|uniref:gliding motility lipoprotein GldH n=1 Tax=Flavobacterium amniphilum TaxID=1834035 RepID=UPI00202A1DE0|nr:gliding motility lipoprotein GldH [Flavobacterium amniphilum]MCL9804052.1 gliding motility lipoprotein GldH [Flavobacterium amniphilum]
MTRKILKNSLLFFFSALLLVSCDETQIYDEYHTIDNGWNRDSVVTFNFDRTASKDPVNLFINVRNNDDYEFSNLFLIVKMEEPKGKIKVDTLEYQMANPDGTLMGEGWSDIKESKLWYHENFTFPENGKYKVSIQQAVRQTGKVKGVEVLNGITEIGFRIESTEKK